MYDEYNEKINDCPHTSCKVGVKLTETPDVMDIIRVRSKENLD